MALRKVSGILKYSIRDINLRICLTGGQSFRWNEAIQEDNCIKNEFVGVIDDKIFILNQNQNFIDYSVYFNHLDADLLNKICENSNRELAEQKHIESILIDYLRLDIDLLSLYEKWSILDPIFKNKLLNNKNLYGIRLLKQNPIETLFSFICSSNNNIKRIRKMIKNLTERYGTLIGTINNESFYKFPSIERLAQNDVEATLRKLNFGYRAKFIQKAAMHLKEKFQDETCFLKLTECSYEQIFNELVDVPGIGNKVSDCICLMAFSKFEAVPIDTHMLNVAYKTYKLYKGENERQSLEKKNITKKQYLVIGEHSNLCDGYCII